MANRCRFLISTRLVSAGPQLRLRIGQYREPQCRRTPDSRSRQIGIVLDDRRHDRVIVLIPRRIVDDAIAAVVLDEIVQCVVVAGERLTNDEESAWPIVAANSKPPPVLDISPPPSMVCQSMS